MQLKILIILFFSIFFCNVTNYKNQEVDATVSTDLKYHEYQLIETDTPVKTIIHFLKWYKQNKDRINIVLISGGGKDSSTFYSVNFNAVNQYLNTLKKSNFLSDNFIQELSNYIKRCDANFKDHPQNDFIAQGFEADLITKLMDDLDLMDNIDSYKVTNLKKAKKQVFIKLKFASSLEIPFVLTKVNNTWLIDSINGKFPEQIGHY